jgi:hypothetical protein
MTRIFTGDYSTGNLLQWYAMDSKFGAFISPRNYVEQYPVQIIKQDADCGYVARYEVRNGDIAHSSGAAAEVQEEYSPGTPPGGYVATHPVGTTRWYAFSTKLDTTFPTNHKDLGWGITNEWKGNTLGQTPTLLFGWQEDFFATAGNWSLYHMPQSAAGVFLGTNPRLLDIPMNLGNWIDVKCQIKWSESDSDGFVRVWINGVRQTFLTGGQTYAGRTVVPGDTHVHYAEGYYRPDDMASVVAKWKRKDPNDIADYWFDWGSDEQAADIRFLPEATTIVDHEVTVPAGITKLADSHTDKTVRWRASGGTDNADYEVTCLITTNTGEEFESTKVLQVRNRTA